MAASAPAWSEAFPDAQGYGAAAEGGRGGRIVWVENLNDAGPGSLRACVEATGPRNCLFRVSGTIVLTQSLTAFGPGQGRLSILGQTAPGDGITLTTDPETASNQRTPLVVRDTRDVIIRHIRLRPQFASTIPNVDAVTIEDSIRVYIDHVSGSWATDENFNSHGRTSELTVAYSIFGEGLRKHSKCALLGSGALVPQSISFWRNLCASNQDRNPDANHVAGSCIEIVDNVFYNAGSEWAEIFSQKPGGTPIALVGNTFKAGPSTNRTTYAINWNDIDSVAPPVIFAEDNATWAPDGKTITLIAPDTSSYVVDQPYCPLSAVSHGDPGRAYYDVLTSAGAFPRDPVDARLTAEVGRAGHHGQGAIVATPGKLHSPISSSQVYADEDGDGMADSVEMQFGAVPGTPDAWIDGDGNDWGNFDDFMEWLSRERLAGRYPR